MNAEATEMEITPKQRELARHAVGFDGRSKTTYRNHYVCEEGGEDYAAWVDMVSKGYALQRAGSAISGGDPVFWVTRDTALFIREKDEHLSREFRP